MDLTKTAALQPVDAPKQRPSIVVKTAVKAGIGITTYIANRGDASVYFARR